MTLGARPNVPPFVDEVRERIDGHLSKIGNRRKMAVDGRTTRRAGYGVSQRCHERIEEVLGWNRGQWRVLEAPGYDMAVAGAYILFEEVGSEFAFECLTGPSMAQVQLGGKRRNGARQRRGWAELLDDGSLEGEICLVNGDDIPFIARRSKTSSTAC
ncbi:hypothetical protein ABIB68_008307 [Bradyrhizobium sp. F1.2.2]